MIGSWNRKKILIQQEHELSMNQMQMMIAQIQPHFLYNSLTALAQLCSKDPKEAKKAIINFADYWRNHINAIDKKESIPFEEELKYVKIYCIQNFELTGMFMEKNYRNSLCQNKPWA